MFLLSEVNDFKRFNAAGVFMSFLGLVPRKLPKENKLVLQKREARGFGEL
ncbi:transposase, IS116/IS110/IS902 domain protein [Leptospira interrogans str. 2003000735]|uniref:Transposase, IS116/IS110/IS902 domain protein n=1 Tax=Leptospira interrogans str. 2002000626 TaxID=996803 RepID=A0A829CSS1_LEPIR|nr:transposase, IS116/IS110/IS902 domain protein [Leptospira interrogans str. 2002000624]EKQ36052.1 transposase, IS116/IS110/IS902 domain protein [Leptospira interrogans str. 2002000621]EKQ49912.1 transposase, IS116/IS110/IS902 domain protein [Leptospira interrogans str. 2002000623]EMJ68218.1 transposase, IS116/IS110/IS902 domain protein [Leptospira interrogans str. 2003000735]EMJ68849.1 transposase, IS116/IS110/IS902 domain protein [Leptospira interrogans str. 2002000632]EMJ83460.1 transposas